MGRTNLFTILTAAGACCLWSGAIAQSDQDRRRDEDRGRVVTTHAQDRGAGREFMTKAAQGNIAEVRIGQLAVRRASAPAVRRFAQRMVDDHRATLDELRKFAASRNFDMHVGMGDENKALYDRLQGLSGRAFDRAYMRAMVMDHEKDVRIWQERADAGRDSEFNRWVADKVPTLKRHLEMAREVSREARRGRD